MPETQQQLIDLVWLSRVARDFYWSRLDGLLLDTPNMAAAAGFYLVYVVGIVFFAVLPALKAESVWMALGYGALFGFFCYATYDLTNLATLKGYTVTVAVVDMAWGTLLTGTSALLGTWVTMKITG